MIYFVCGLIGSGKTTWAKQHFQTVTDADEERSKTEQIRKTLTLSEHGDVAHITCYPTEEERLVFPDAKWIWIDTDPVRAMTNVMTRGRITDMVDLPHVRNKNEMLYVKLASCRHPIRRITVFSDNERW